MTGLLRRYEMVLSFATTPAKRGKSFVVGYLQNGHVEWADNRKMVLNPLERKSEHGGAVPPVSTSVMCPEYPVQVVMIGKEGSGVGNPHDTGGDELGSIPIGWPELYSA